MLKLLAVILALAPVLAAAPSARAATTDLEFYTGDDLYSQCASKPGDDDFQARQARCLGYVVGVSDAEQAGQAGAARRGQVLTGVCLPAATGAAQVVDTVIRFLEAHPEKRHFAAQDLVLEGLSEAFPCK